MEEWVEVRGKTVEVAVQAALAELGISDRSEVEVEVIHEPERGFLGIGGKDATIKVKKKTAKRESKPPRPKGGKRSDTTSKRPSGPSGDRTSQSPRGPRRDGRDQRKTPRRPNDNRPRGNRSDHTRRQEPPDFDALSKVVNDFLVGLLDAFGLEGEVKVWVDDEMIMAEVTGDQTAALVGTGGSVLSAIHELTKTVMQRKMHQSSRLRLDIAGYAARRQEALAIYSNQLIDQVLEDGGELMLDPMSAGDRKVVHSTVAEREGVRSYSEGEPPNRYVVISALSSSRNS